MRREEATKTMSRRERSFKSMALQYYWNWLLNTINYVFSVVCMLGVIYTSMRALWILVFDNNIWHVLPSIAVTVMFSLIIYLGGKR